MAGAGRACDATDQPVVAPAAPEDRAGAGGGLAAGPREEEHTEPPHWDYSLTPHLLSAGPARAAVQARHPPHARLLLYVSLAPTDASLLYRELAADRIPAETSLCNRNST